MYIYVYNRDSNIIEVMDLGNNRNYRIHHLILTIDL